MSAIGWYVGWWVCPPFPQMSFQWLGRRKTGPAGWISTSNDWVIYVCPFVSSLWRTKVTSCFSLVCHCLQRGHMMTVLFAESCTNKFIESSKFWISTFRTTQTGGSQALISRLSQQNWTVYIAIKYCLTGPGRQGVPIYGDKPLQTNPHQYAIYWLQYSQIEIYCVGFKGAARSDVTIVDRRQ